MDLGRIYSIRMVCLVRLKEYRKQLEHKNYEGYFFLSSHEHSLDE